MYEAVAYLYQLYYMSCTSLGIGFINDNTGQKT